MRTSPSSLAERTGSTIVGLLIVLYGAYQGLELEVLTVEIRGWFVRVAAIDAVAATLTFSAIVVLSGILLAREVHAGSTPQNRLEDGPRVAAIVPAYKDAGVLEESTESLLASNYEDLEVLLVCESGDEATLAAALDLSEHPQVRVLENRYPGSKAGAVNTAVEQVDADHFAILDADERVDPDFVPVGMHHLVEDDRDLFQARRVPRVSGSVEALAYCERLLLHAGYKLVEPFGFTFCRSSSVLFSREAFERVGGLEDLLAEDIDFAHKCYRADLDVVLSRSLTSEMEAPHTLADLWGQRKRWRMGHLEVLLKALRRGFDRGGLRGKLSTLRLLTTFSAGLFLLGLAAKVLLLAILDAEVLFLLPFLAIALMAAPMLAYDHDRGHVTSMTPAMALIPLIYPGFGLLTIRSTFAYAFSWDGEWYQVDKTGS